MSATIRHISGDQNEIELTNGKKYKAVESDGSCRGCAFKPTGPCYIIPCSSAIRTTAEPPRHDGREVIFKEQESDCDNEG